MQCDSQMNKNRNNILQKLPAQKHLTDAESLTKVTKTKILHIFWIGRIIVRVSNTRFITKLCSISYHPKPAVNDDLHLSFSYLSL